MLNKLLTACKGHYETAFSLLQVYKMVWHVFCTRRNRTLAWHFDLGSIRNIIVASAIRISLRFWIPRISNHLNSCPALIEQLENHLRTEGISLKQFDSLISNHFM